MRKNNVRRQAEKRVAQHPVTAEEALSTDKGRLLHELHVHQAELEIQNEELREAQLELEESRNKYADLYDCAPIGYLTLHRDGRIKQANLKASEMLGIDRATLIQRAFLKFVPKEDWALYATHVRTVFTTGLLQQCDLRLQPKQGALIHVQMQSLVEDKNGNEHSHSFRTALIDITQRKQAEEEIRTLNNSLEQRVRQRTEQLRALVLELTQSEQRERKRLASVLHDHLQQLLVGLKFTIEIAQKTAGDTPVQPVLHRVVELADESIRTTKSLTMDLSPPILHEAGLVAALHWLGRWMEEKHGLAVAVAAEAEIASDDEGVGVLLFQCIRELLLNVIKHAGVRSARILVTEQPDSNLLCIEVSDSGSGFDPQEGESCSSSGFGLSSIRERLRILGGHMKIDSRPGQGARISLLVPQPKPTLSFQGTQTAEPSAEAVSRAAKAAVSGKTTVLVVDDHRILREGVVQLLRIEPDMEVIGEAGDGEGAILAARKLHPDVIIMDITMPGMNGIEATRRICLEMPHVRVIGLSMHAEADRAEEMRRAGACAYLSKGGPAHELINAIRQAKPLPAAG